MNDLFTIDCGEILLREYLIEDVDALYELTSQPEVYEFLPDFKTTKEQRLDWVTNYEIPINKEFLAAVPNIEEQTYLRLAITLKETGELIGFCMTGIKEELPAPNREIVYAISKHYRNRGYATTASKGLITYLFEKTNVDLLNAVALIQNVSSNKVIQKIGFSFIEEIDIESQKYYHYTLHKMAMKEIIIKRIYDSFEHLDGYRVLVDRLWPRGVTKEKANLTCWAKDLAPRFGHRAERFIEFRMRYIEELRNDELKSHKVEQLCQIATKHDITLLYAAKDPNCNNAVVLKEEILRRLNK